MAEKLVTSELLEAYLACPTKCYLRSIGEAPPANAYTSWSQSTNDAYRGKGISRLLTTAPEVDFPKLKTSASKDGRSLVAIDQVVRSHNLQARIHVVQRLAFCGTGNASRFVPLRFTLANRLSHADRMMAAFDAFVLSKDLGHEVGVAQIVHGENWSKLNVKTCTVSRKLSRTIAKVAKLLCAVSPPTLTLNRHCPECEFRDRCRTKATESDDLSLLAGLPEKEKLRLNGKGIFTTRQLSYTFRPRRRAKRLAAKPEKYHHSLRARAVREQKIHVVGKPEFRIERGTPVFFDVEGIPDRNFYYLIGLRVEHESQVDHHSLWADTREDEQRIWTSFLNVLPSIKDPVLMHYGSFETTFLRKMRVRYGDAPDGSEAARATGCPINLLSAMYARVYFPVVFKWAQGKRSFPGVRMV